MDTPPLEHRIRTTLASVIGDAAWDVDAETLLADAFPERYSSLGAIEFVSAIELEFDLEVDFVVDDIRHWFTTLERVVTYVSRRLEDQAALS